MLAALAVGTYLGYSSLYFRAGFPLDDAWIHQTYARNLALLGEWSFIPGVPSGGSTSPLWTVLLVPGAWLQLPPILWAGVLGWAALVAIGLTTRSIVATLVPDGRQGLDWLALLVCLEWHLVWSAVSGMETLLASAVILGVFWGLITQRFRPVWLGVLTGVAAWLRPDGITLAAPVALVLVFSEGMLRDKAQKLLQYAAGFLCLFVPYLGFNLQFAGGMWPTTFFAKQAEYAAELQAPLLSRILEQAILPLVGAGLILLPGLVYLLALAVRKRLWAVLFAGMWCGGYALMYALRLPVSYQHGRYLIPMMPVYFAFGLAGMLSWSQPASVYLIRRVISRVWVVSYLAVLVMFYTLGGRAFSRDVAFIESEMVETARWIAAHTPGDTLLAVHDIGAIGYWSQRNMLDLAGLISPDVIPFIRDEARLADYLDARGADYLVTFPGWYPALVDNRRGVYQSAGRFAIEQGYENMVVFEWKAPP